MYVVFLYAVEFQLDCIVLIEHTLYDFNALTFINNLLLAQYSENIPYVLEKSVFCRVQYSAYISTGERKFIIWSRYSISLLIFVCLL